MLKKFFPLLLIFPLLFGGCDSLKSIANNAGDVLLGGSAIPTDGEVGSGLKQALEFGITSGANKLSLEDGYLGNALVKILFPPEAQKVENTLRSLGLDPMVDRLVVAINRGAEKAAKEAAPIFVSAIKSMTFNDAMNILLSGDKESATKYLNGATSTQLENAFTPVIEKSLDAVNANLYWEEVVTRYNKIPLVEDVNPDLTSYVTERALDGLFKMVAKEELRIRDNVSARNTDLLQKVFGYADSQK